MDGWIYDTVSGAYLSGPFQGSIPVYRIDPLRLMAGGGIKGRAVSHLIA